MPFEFVCGTCHTPFLRHTQTIGRQGAFCSRDCYWKSMRKDYPNRICLGCGQEFDPRMGGRIKSRLDRDYCTWDCYAKWSKETFDRWFRAQSGDGCWHWPNGLNKDGYGVTNRDRSQHLVHRVAWESANGPIPAGMTIDHMCHNLDPMCARGADCLHRRCSNPAHLQVAEAVENAMRGNCAGAKNARKTHCLNGHALSGDNLYITPAGARQCRRCQIERNRRSLARKKARAAGVDQT